jgi:O-antigen ligase
MTTGYFVTSWRTRQSWKFTTVLGGALCVMVANLALTLTRGAWIGVFIATIYTAIYLERRLFWGLLIVVMLFPLVLPQSVKERFNTIREHPSGFMSERPQWWKASAQLIAKYPITGIGLGRFRHEYQLHGPPGMFHKPYHAHNIYLQVAVEQGIPSLILFVWILFLIFRQTFALRKGRDFWQSGLFIGGSGFLISALVYGLADNILHQRPLLMFWFINGLVFYVTDADRVA